MWHAQETATMLSFQNDKMDWEQNDWDEWMLGDDIREVVVGPGHKLLLGHDTAFVS